MTGQRVALPARDWSWQDRAACRARPDLPWTGEVDKPREVGADAAMAGVCAGCPVRDMCRTMAEATRATAGFWAGRWRNNRARWVSVDEPDHAPRCLWCQRVLPDRLHGNFQLCSPACVRARKSDRQRRPVLAGRADRVCAWCREPMPAGVNGNALVCSEACRRARYNAARRHPKPAVRVCAWCGGPIPAGRRAGTVLCSPECRSARAETRRPHRSHRPTRTTDDTDQTTAGPGPAADQGEAA